MKFDVKIAKALLSFTLKYSKSELQARTGIPMKNIEAYCAGKISELPAEDWDKLYPCLKSKLPEDKAYHPAPVFKEKVNAETITVSEIKNPQGNKPPASLDLPRISLNVSPFRDQQSTFSTTKSLKENTARSISIRPSIKSDSNTTEQSDFHPEDKDTDKLVQIYRKLTARGREHIIQTAQLIQDLEQATSL